MKRKATTKQKEGRGQPAVVKAALAKYVSIYDLREKPSGDLGARGNGFVCEKFYFSAADHLIVAQLDSTGRFTVLATGYGANLGQDCLRGCVGGYNRVALGVVLALCELGWITKKAAKLWIEWYEHTDRKDTIESAHERLREEAARLGYVIVARRRAFDKAKAKAKANKATKNAEARARDVRAVMTNAAGGHKRGGRGE